MYPLTLAWITVRFRVTRSTSSHKRTSMYRRGLLAINPRVALRDFSFLPRETIPSERPETRGPAVDGAHRLRVQYHRGFWGIQDDGSSVARYATRGYYRYDDGDGSGGVASACAQKKRLTPYPADSCRRIETCGKKSTLRGFIAGNDLLKDSTSHVCGGERSPRFFHRP